jgi:hypothetical protein
MEYAKKRGSVANMKYNLEDFTEDSEADDGLSYVTFGDLWEEVKSLGKEKQYADGGNISEKNYYIQNNIGKAKYTISYFDGKTFHNDGSPFYGIKIFKNKVAFMRGIRDLKEQGYKSKYK